MRQYHPHSCTDSFLYTFPFYLGEEERRLTTFINVIKNYINKWQQEIALKYRNYKEK
jgi:hypothetical protein